MFKFKMLARVLVAVFVLGVLIESSLKLCIAMSIDLNESSRSVAPQKTWPTGVADSSSQLDEQVEPDGSGSPSASRTSTSTQTAISSSTSAASPTSDSEASTKTDTIADSLNLVQTIESNGKLNYFGEIYVGERQEPFMVLFDLSSSAFWLPSSECKSLYCISRHKYNKTGSATHIDDGRLANLSYTAGVHGASVSTRLVRDKLSFASVTIDDQLFGEALQMDGEPFAYMPVDGFLGLGFKDLTAANGSSDASETPFERMYRDGLLREPIFSLLIKEVVNQYEYSTKSGELTFGRLAQGYEQAELTYVPVTHADYWEFRIESVTVRHPNGNIDIEHGCESACPAILDTGSTFISGHFTDVDRMNRAMGAYRVSDSLYRLSQCDLALLPNLVFKIGGTEFSLEPRDYVTLNKVSGTVVSCYSNLRVVKAEQYPFWILGELFLKRHYIVFDYGQRRLGFAQSKSAVQARRQRHII